MNKRHLHRIPICIFLFALYLPYFSQVNSYDRYWYFGPFNAFDWSSGNPVQITPCAMNNIEGSQTTNGLSGNLLFYGGDDKIYNANHTLMPNSVGLNCTTTPKQGPVAVQVPGNANRYYYIYPGGAGSPLKYSIIDMTMQTGLGDVDNAFKNIQLRAVVAEGIIPIRKTNACNEYWVLSHNIGSSFYVEQITAAGIANFNTQNVGPASTSMGAYMDYAPATGKLAMLYGSFNVALFDFNAATGAVTNYVNVPLPSVPFCLEYYSVAFSPNGNKLYVGGGYGQNHLVQVDLANGNLVTSVATGNGGNTLKLGPDGKIYGGILYTAFIGIVNNPDLPGLACNYTPNAINTGNVTFSDIGLPHIGLHDFNSSNASITGNSTICAGDMATLNGSGGASYLWSTSATTQTIVVSPTVTTTYILTVSSGSCSDTAQFTVNVLPPPVASITGNSPICQGTNSVLTASGGVTYLWNTGATTSSVNVSPNTTTVYSVIVSAGACADTAFFTLTINPDPVANAGPDISIIVGSNSQLNATGGGSYSWSPSGGLSCANCPDPIASPSVTTTYCVVVTNGSGCTDSDCMTITIDINCGEIFVPTAFSPNNDNANEQFYVLGSCITQMHLAVFDRWGEKVFESDDQAKKWDGTYRGAILNSAVFVFYLDATLLNGEVVSLKGNVTLIR